MKAKKKSLSLTVVLNVNFYERDIRDKEYILNYNRAILRVLK